MDTVKLTRVDMEAVQIGDSNYINSKGAKLYQPESYARAVEYYRLAAAMGNVQAISNLGYCYLYGRGIEANLSLAIAYFRMACMRGSIDAAYKLGDIYGNMKWGIPDAELSLYYYRLAVGFVMKQEDLQEDEIFFSDTLKSYPSLCFAMGRELSEGGSLNTDLDAAYQYLMQAKIGYETALRNGDAFYRSSYEEVLKLMEDKQFDPIRNRYADDEDEEEDVDEEE